jgi:hypothetical protein
MVTAEDADCTGMLLVLALILLVLCVPVHINPKRESIPGLITLGSMETSSSVSEFILLHLSIRLLIRNCQI